MPSKPQSKRARDRQIAKEIDAVLKKPLPKTTGDSLTRVRQAVSAMPAPGRWGPDKIFISELHREVGKDIGMSLPEFKQWLVAQNRQGTLYLARADMPKAMERSKVDGSEILDRGSSFHFVIDPEGTY